MVSPSLSCHCLSRNGIMQPAPPEGRFWDTYNLPSQLQSQWQPFLSLDMQDYFMCGDSGYIRGTVGNSGGQWMKRVCTGSGLPYFRNSNRRGTLHAVLTSVKKRSCQKMVLGPQQGTDWVKEQWGRSVWEGRDEPQPSSNHQESRWPLTWCVAVIRGPMPRNHKYHYYTELKCPS